MVFVTEMECVYCAVREEFLKNIQVFLVFIITNSPLGCDVIQVGRQKL